MEQHVSFAILFSLSLYFIFNDLILFVLESPEETSLTQKVSPQAEVLEAAPLQDDPNMGKFLSSDRSWIRAFFPGFVFVCNQDLRRLIDDGTTEQELQQKKSNLLAQLDALTKELIRGTACNKCLKKVSEKLFL